MDYVSSIIDIINISLEESGFKDMNVELDNSYDKKENPDLTRPKVVFKKILK